MGLFSPRNLVAPFTNTVNLIAIIFTILLFAVLRFSLGRVHVKAPVEKTISQSSTQAESSLEDIRAILNRKNEDKLDIEAVPKKPKEGEKAKARIDGDIIDLKAEIAALEKNQSAAKGSKEKTPVDENANLSEVEKALGLR
ncbi:MAG: hypothetical protein GYA55_09190 [SAR324 cluster bacterium]|uniref:Uncharacterized protein n=1 Tax=SAR324 cluster bacterium TaxID=2024889 RepID=A0A7X9IKL6_9DELT|nr:hypothetical protein [SAR324 cluster bacterium]